MARPNRNNPPDVGLLSIAENHQREPGMAPIDVVVDTHKWEHANIIARAAGSLTMMDLVGTVGMNAAQAAATVEQMKMDGLLAREGKLSHTGGDPLSRARVAGPILRRYSVLVEEYDGEPDLEWVEEYKRTERVWNLEVSDRLLPPYQPYSATLKTTSGTDPDTQPAHSGDDDSARQRSRRQNDLDQQRRAQEADEDDSDAED